MFNISKFSKWPPLWARDKLFLGSYTGRRIYQKDSHEHFRHFELLIDAVIQILTEIYQFQIWPTLWPGDVINEIKNIYLYNCSHNLMIHVHRKFNDDIFARFLVIMKNVISFIKEYFEATLWRHWWRHHHKNTIFGMIWDDLLISEVKWKLCLIFQNFQNGRHLSSQQTFLPGSYTGSWIYQTDSHEHSGHFELLIDALAVILTEIYQFQNLTYFVILWRHQWRHESVKHNLHN